jgi:hypothetical protein
MLREAISTLLVLAMYGLIGLGPATLLVGERPGRLPQVLALAPVLGYGLIALLAFPLVRFVGPATHWAWPLALLLGVGSLALFLRHDRRRAGREVRQEWRRYLGRGAFVMALWALLMAPLGIRGLPYAVFRSNPSDAYTYLGWAENLHTVDWPTLTAGAELSAANGEGLRRLAQASPVALLNARHLRKPIPLPGPGTLAWAAALTRVPVYRLYYAHNALAFLLAALATLALAALLPGIGRLKDAVAGVVALGVWPRFILETDAAFQINALPLLLALAYAWIRVEQAPRPLLSWPRVFLGVLVGLLLWFYVPMLLPLAVAAVVYYGLALWRRLLSWRIVAYHGVTGLIALAALSVTGQVDFALRNVWRLLLAFDVEGARDSKVLQAMAAEGYALLWGWPKTTLAAAMPAMVRPVVALGLDGYALFLTIGFLAAAVLILSRWRRPEAPMVMALALAGPILMAVLGLRGDDKPAGQAFLYGIGFLTLAVALLVPVSRQVARFRLGRWVRFLVLLWCAGQIGLGAVLPFTPLPEALAATRMSRVRERFDLDPILKALAVHPPARLLVFAPDSLGWPVALHTQFAFAPYRPYFAHGLVMDNTADYANFWAEEVPTWVDYAVLPRALEGVDYERLGVEIARSPAFVLYRISPEGLSYLLGLAHTWRAQEEAQPPFPALRS